MDTFQKVGTVIRESVSSGQQALGHVGDFANHAKSAIFSTRFALPKIIQKEVPGFVGEPKKQTIIITPRIFDTSNENKVAQSIGGTKYIKLGSILDGLGVSNRNPNLTFKKITLEPRNAFSNEQQNIPSIQQPFSQYFRNVRVENINNVEKDADFVRDTVNNLEIAKFSVGAKNLEDFILKMKNQLQSFMNKNMIQNNLGIGTPQERRKEDHIKKPSRKWYFKTAQSKPNAKKPSTTKVNQNDDETVGASFIPTELTHPYLNQPTNNQLQGFMHVNNKWPKISKPNEDIGPLLGAINPIMFERIFNETLRSSGKTGTPHEIFSDYRSKNKTDEPTVNNEDKVSTSFSVKGQILKPFMGQATSKNKKDFFKKYQPSKDKTSSASLEYEENNYDYETTWY
nr:uncharacterized protein LOC111515221 [Leptinotarsa decemlineata]